jgi:hypothetical protein
MENTVDKKKSNIPRLVVFFLFFIGGFSLQLYVISIWSTADVSRALTSWSEWGLVAMLFGSLGIFISGILSELKK